LKKAKQSTTYSYKDNLKKLGTVKTVEDFWAHYSHIVRPNELQGMDLHFFREGIDPMWEDPVNVNGGKWVLRIKKGMASRCWEDSVLAFIGDQFELGDELCGLVLSIKYKEDTLSFWNKTAADKEVVENIKETIKRVLNLSGSAPLEYKPHNEALAETAAKESKLTAGKKPAASEGGGGSEQGSSSAAGKQQQQEDSGAANASSSAAGAGGGSDSGQEDGAGAKS